MYGFNITPGVRDLANKNAAWWLITDIMAYSRTLNEEYQFWRLDVRPDETAVLTCVPDKGEAPVFTQEIVLTDYPLEGVDLWVFGHDTIMLPDEY